jgi:hypothetical protein
VTLPTPYRDAAPTYRAAGWLGVLPIPYGTKKLLARGWTGHEGRWPSYADIQAWCDSDRPDHGAGNIALRMPPDIIGIDIDGYDGKQGATTLAAHTTRWGPLPPTWRSTSRDDDISGIALYRVPEGLRWPGQAGPHIEIIQTAHRYAVVAPSVHPDTGNRYRWIRPDGITSTSPPDPDELPPLPDPWIAGLTGGELADHTLSADLNTGAVQQWIVDHHRPHTCRAMNHTLGKLLAELGTSSAHEALRRIQGLARLAEQGHTGLADALTQARAAFHAEVTHPRHGTTRTPDDAEAEFRRSLAGAVRKVVGMPSTDSADTAGGREDPCLDPFGDIVDRASQPISFTAPTPPGQQLPPLVIPPVLPGPSPGPGTPHDGPTAGQASPGEPGAARTSWWPVDLAAVLSSDNPEPEPTILARDDKKCLFYPGKVNALLGESESGKTWVALHAAAQELTAGHDVAYVDFEDTAPGVTGRLTALGIDRDALLQHLTYIAPEEGWSAQAVADLGETLASRDRTLIVLDGVNAAMTLLGLDTNSTTDATKFAQVLLDRLARTGAAVVTIDHVAKNKETRGKGGIGSQAKRAMIRGCAISVEVVTPFGRGMVGKLKLFVDKDRPGYVRGFSAFAKNAGIAILSSDPSSGNVRIVVQAAEELDAESRATFRPTGLMDRISRHLAGAGEDLSQTQIEKEVPGKAEYIRQALRALLDGKYIEQIAGGRGGGHRYRHRHLYREIDELVEQPDAP